MNIVNTRNHTLLLVKTHENFLILASFFLRSCSESISAQEQLKESYSYLTILSLLI